jgi:hypothetical protein
MRYLRIILVALVFVPVLYSCNKDLNVNADWRDITVVYGILSQNEDTTYIKITKAFLGEGDAMQFAKIPDSSVYPGNLDVKMEAWSGNNLVNPPYSFDTITIHTKKAGDSIFYFPSQLVYYCKTGHLNENYTYKLKITHKKTGIVDSATTKLVHSFTVEIPDPFIKQVDYLPGHNFEVKFDPAYGGKRYQLLIRFHYRETTSSGTTEKTLDWLVFNDLQVVNPYEIVTDPILKSFSGDIFYTVLKGNIKSIKADPTVTSRTARWVDYIFSVASEDLNTYMEVTEPSPSIIQERPSFSNIYNGIGLFSSRFVNEIDTIRLGNNTLDQIKNDTALINRGF